MFLRLVFAALFFSALSQAKSHQHPLTTSSTIGSREKDGLVVLPEDMTHPTVIFVLAGGASIGAEKYVPLLQRVQLKTRDFSVVAAFPKFPLDSPSTVSGMNASMERLFALLDEKLAPFQNKIQAVFYGGHSRGGIVLQDWISAHYEDIAATKYRPDGVVFFASALQRKYRPDKFGQWIKGRNDLPTLTVGGDLDGLFRVLRLAEALYHERNDTRKDVLVVPGASHMSFASGTPPVFVRINDLKPDLSETEAHDLIATGVSGFIAKTIAGKVVASYNDMKHISDHVLQPMVQLLELEGSYHLKPPCNELPKNHQGVDCWKGSPWSEKMQATIARFTSEDNVQVNVQDAFWKVYLVPVHLPNITSPKCPTFTKSRPKCTVNVTTVTQCVYAALDQYDTGFTTVSCSELRVKFKSVQALHEANGQPANFTLLDDRSDVCQRLNQITIDYGLQFVPPHVMNRFKERHGFYLVAGPDFKPSNGGVTWIWNPISIKRDYVGRKMAIVKSPNMRTPTDFFIRLSAGFHYCKLLTPARVVEWMYTDGLKLV